jgi:hypothetical protein
MSTNNDHIDNCELTTVVNLVDQAKLNTVSESGKSHSRKIGKLQLSIPTPLGAACLILEDYEFDGAKRSIELTEPENVVVSPETNQLDVILNKDGIEAAVSMMTAMTGFIGMLASKDVEMSNARREHEIKMEEMRHNLKMMELRLTDELNQNRHERVMKEKSFKA